METDGGGWTVFQRRESGLLDFYLGWNDYKEGFSYLDHEFWLGLDNIHRLTVAGGTNTLRVDLEDFEDNTAFAEYSTFNIGDSSTEYTLTIAGYSGTAGDSMHNTHENGRANNMKFSTKDNDNDAQSSNCATGHTGAWWYNKCHRSNLNGQYLGSGSDSWNGIVWYSWGNSRRSLKFSEMKLRSN